MESLKSFAATPAWEPFAAVAFPALVSESAARRPIAARGGGLFAVADGASTVAAAVSTALDGLDDKGLLCRALRAAGVEDAAPATTVIAWDAEAFDAPPHGGDLLVLKPAGGYGGDVAFYGTGDVAAIRREIAYAAELTRALPFHEERAFIPGWVLQAHVRSRLIRGGRKFHLRGYVVVANGTWSVHRRAEVRVAAAPLASATDPADAAFRSAHVTNGAGGTATERCLAADVADELPDADARLRAFLLRVFGALRREAAADAPGSFAVGAADVMVDESGEFSLLELNVNPSAPPFEACAPAFADHLARFLRETLALALDGAHPSFTPVPSPRGGVGSR